ncbi:MAG: orotidine-5'-phosphate decarboxylase, partial [Aestuariivirga sp.]
AQDLVHMLKGHVGMVKIGMEFFYAHGPQGYEAVAALGIPVFLDLKLHDIPNTVASALKSLLRLSPIPAIINIHASGGSDMMKAARDAVEGRCKLIAVTVLTSLSNADIAAFGFARSTDEQALLLAKLTHQAGLDGIVCSALDLAKVRTELPRKFLTVVPGIRPADALTQDQKRVMTPKQAITAGADILVIGRPITGAADPAQAALDIVTSLA